MQHSLILTLGDIGTWVLIALFVVPAIGKWIASTKKNQQEQRRRDEGMVSQDIDQLAARRREQLRQASRQRSQANTSADLSGGLSAGASGGTSGGASGGGGGSPGNMTMAERIARARSKAQYEQRTQSAGPQSGPGEPGEPGGPAGSQIPNEAQRRALEQRQAELERRRQAAKAQQQNQQQAQQRAKQQARQQRAQAHQRAQTQARQRGKLIHETVPVPEPTSSVPRRLVPSKPAQRQKAAPRSDSSVQSIGLDFSKHLSRDELRRAIILKEVLDKPLALREGGAFNF